MTTSEIIGIAGFAMALVVWIVKLAVRIKAIEIKQELQDKHYDRLMEKLEEVSRDVNFIKIELQNKQNRL